MKVYKWWCNSKKDKITKIHSSDPLLSKLSLPKGHIFWKWIASFLLRKEHSPSTLPLQCWQTCRRNHSGDSEKLLAGSKPALLNWELCLLHLWEPAERSSCYRALEVPPSAAFHTSPVSTSLGTLGQSMPKKAFQSQSTQVCGWFPLNKEQGTAQIPHSMPPPSPWPGWHPCKGRRTCSYMVNLI